MHLALLVSQRLAGSRMTAQIDKLHSLWQLSQMLAACRRGEASRGSWFRWAPHKRQHTCPARAPRCAAGIFTGCRLFPARYRTSAPLQPNWACSCCITACKGHKNRHNSSLTSSQELQFLSNRVQSTHLPCSLPEPGVQRVHLPGPRLQSAGRAVGCAGAGLSLGERFRLFRESEAPQQWGRVAVQPRRLRHRSLPPLSGTPCRTRQRALTGAVCVGAGHAAALGLIMVEACRKEEKRQVHGQRLAVGAGLEGPPRGANWGIWM